MSSLPPGEMPLLPVIAIAVLLSLLVVVLVLVVRTVRRGMVAQAGGASAGGTNAATQTRGVAALSEAPPDDPEQTDLTRLKAFSPDLLPRLSFEDDDAEKSDEAAVVEDSKPSLRFEDGALIEGGQPAPNDLIVTSAASLTDRGLKRTRNEDACLVDSKLDLYVVADGMGGYAGGDVAANTAVAEVHKALQGARSLPANAPGPVLLSPAEWPSFGRELSVAIERANAIIHDVSGKSKQLEGMGTTFLAARFARREQRVYVAYVGDSRLYRLRAGKLQQLTVDHTLGAKGVVGPLASNIRRAVGVSPTVKVDLLVDKPMPADLYLLCSDGVYKMVKDDEMVSILSGTGAVSHQLGWKEEDLKERVASIVEAANAAGGKDNITVVLVGVGDAVVADRAAPRPVESRV